MTNSEHKAFCIPFQPYRYNGSVPLCLAENVFVALVLV